jgi:hypothetical protein
MEVKYLIHLQWIEIIYLRNIEETFVEHSTVYEYDNRLSGKKSVFYGVRVFITVFKSPYWDLSWTNLIQSTPLHPF